MDQELIDLGPEFWSIPDLDGPSDDCPMPEPIRPPGTGAAWFTCPHCTITFILAQAADGVTGWKEVWVNSHQHTQMVNAMDDLYREESRHYELDNIYWKR